MTTEEEAVSIEARSQDAAKVLARWEKANQSPAAQKRLVADEWRLWRLSRDLAGALDDLLACVRSETTAGEIADPWCPPGCVTVGAGPRQEDPPDVWDYSLRVHATVAGKATPVEIGFPDWDAISDWLVSPGRWEYGEVESITITKAGL